MAGRYGMSFAKKHIEEGDYEDAVAAATAAIEGGDQGPEPLFDRATACELLERYEDAARDFEAAIAKNNAAKELDPFVLDDAYFSALVAGAKQLATKDPRAASALLDRYAAVCPDGAHRTDAKDWQRRVTGAMPSLLDKTKPIDAS
jgi:tetratricopeptide (TPR) repeat protein